MKYIISEPKTRNETENDFIARIRIEALKKQVVSVKFRNKKYSVLFGVPGPIITKFGKFQMISAFVKGGRWGKHYFLFYPNLETLLKRKKIFLRIDSGCFSGMVLGDITCDCGGQLKISQKTCINAGGGIVIEVPQQDGRGWGEYKMANQRIMDELSMTTVEAARAFYVKDELTDIRTYNEAIIILKTLGFTKKNYFLIATNNPKKINAFKSLGMNIIGTKSVKIKHANH